MTGKSHTIGSRRQVWNGTAKKTSGGLLKSDLMLNKNGRIVSKSKHASAKKENRLAKHGYSFKKGVFGVVKMGSRKMRKGSRKQKGGHVNINMPNSAFLPPVNINAGSGIDGAGITPGGPNTQALMAGGRRRRARKMSGGSGSNGQNMMNPATVFSEGPMGPVGSGNGIAGQGITPGGPNTIALMAGGKRGRGRGRGRKMSGGTMNYNQMAAAANQMGIPLPYGPGGVTNAALNAS
jgi:hypothetical protein